MADENNQQQQNNDTTEALKGKEKTPKVRTAPATKETTVETKPAATESGRDFLDETLDIFGW